MADINQKQGELERVWTPEEIRLAAGDDGPAPEMEGEE
jgi:hypothetical protein